MTSLYESNRDTRHPSTETNTAGNVAEAAPLVVAPVTGTLGFVWLVPVPVIVVAVDVAVDPDVLPALDRLNSAARARTARRIYIENFVVAIFLKHVSFSSKRDSSKLCLDQVFKACDENGDGSVSLKEFENWVKKNPEDFEKFVGVLNILPSESS